MQQKHSSKTERKFLYEIIKPYRHFAFLIILLSLIASVLDGISIGMLVPLLTHLQGMEGADKVPRTFQWLVDLLSAFESHQQVFLTFGFVVAAVFLKNLFIATSIRLAHWLSARLLADLRMKATKLMMTVGLDFHFKSRTGELIDKAMNNTNQVEFMLRIMIEDIANLLTLAVLITMLFLLSWQLTLLAIMIGSVCAGVLFLYTRNLRKLGTETATAGRDLLSSVYESISGIQLIKSYSKEQQQVAQIHDKIDKHRRVVFRLNFRNFSIHPITDSLGTVAIVLLCSAAMVMYDMNTQLMLTQLLPFVYILLRMVPLVKILNGQKAMIISNWPFLKIVHEFLRLDNKPFIKDGNREFMGFEQEIRFNSVCFSYDADSDAVLKGIDFSIPAERTTAIIGESGAGKSTITNLLLRFYDPQQGAILIDGTPLPDFQLASFHRKVGIVSQDTFLFNNTVKFNIAFSLAEVPDDNKIIAATKKAGAHEFIMALPDGYDTLIGDRGIRLSGGQRQRISIARAMLKDPEILILDEATSSLDTRTEKLIHQAIADLSHNRTVIIIAHRLSTIKNADQIIVLKNGRVVETGGEQGLMQQKGEYYKLAKMY